jgi:hypothetical protein
MTLERNSFIPISYSLGFSKLMQSGSFRCSYFLQLLCVSSKQLEILGADKLLRQLK